VLLSPPDLELGWGETTQRRVHPLTRIHVIQEAPDLTLTIIIVQILRQVNFLLLQVAFTSRWKLQRALRRPQLYS